MQLKLRNQTLDLTPAKVMGILNVTPDSFSDGGRYFSADAAARRAEEMNCEGADIIDVGGESTRPGAKPVTVAEELRRVVPAIEAIKRLERERLGRMRAESPCYRCPRLHVSVDTRHVTVAKAAIGAGASMVNCVETLSAAMAKVVRETGAAVVCRCRSREDYERAVEMVGDRERVLFDPMIGFGTSRSEDLELMERIPEFSSFAPVVAAVSRKRIIRYLGGGEDVGDRLGGSVGAAIWCAMNGAAVLRVHDVKETFRALSIVNYMDRAGRRGTAIA